MGINLMILASDAVAAKEAQDAGIDRIFFDLEFINKHERQRGLNTVKSTNDISYLPKIREVITTSQLLVRTNPINTHLSEEIDKTIDYGADILMLPMATDRKDVETFIKYIKGKAKVNIMIESTQALARLDSILEVDGIDEVFIGLNDLHLGLGLNFMFEVLSGGLVDYIADKCKKQNIPFGFGGIARIGDGRLQADYILGEHYRMGSSSVILSRTFKGEVNNPNGEKIVMQTEIRKVREKEEEIKKWNTPQFEENRNQLKKIVNSIVEDLNRNV